MVGVDAHGVEEGFGAFVVAVAVDVIDALAGGAHVAQSDAGGVSGRYALHALAVVDGELVKAGVFGGVDAEALVVPVEECALVAGAAAVGAVAGVVGGGGDVGIAFDGGLVGAAAGAEHVVAGAASGAVHAVADAGRPGAGAVGLGVEVGGVVESWAG